MLRSGRHTAATAETGVAGEGECAGGRQGGVDHQGLGSERAEGKLHDLSAPTTSSKLGERETESNGGVTVTITNHIYHNGKHGEDAQKA